ncbi:MAG: DpnII family type II restriction endonuclease [Peptoanaerobacter stomatis]|uniref:DpnII family type II restriction endonuclease n=1 Tax=Peptoanaerobacter stomatis TaxID=796937 RepID=UPI003F9F55AD
MYLEMGKDELAKQFEENLLDTNRGYNYYVDWSNISGYDKYSIEIHAMDVLINCKEEDFYCKFRELLEKLPNVIEVFPYLFALAKNDRVQVIKNGELKIIGTEIDSENFETFNFNGKRLKENFCEEVLGYYNFFCNMGLKDLFQNLLEKSVQDYIVGVLVGLDSNGRKNRGGTAFELACEPMIREICERHNITVLTQKTFKSVNCISSNDVIANRKADFILINENETKLMNIEVNFFNGGGSKPEEIINSYIQRQDALSTAGISFCLLTDGNCWKGTTNQLKVGLNGLKYLMNFNLAKKGMLEEAIIRELC